MNIGIWKKKPSKKELFDVIKIQEEEISRLNKEKMNFNIVIRNKKPIRIDTQGLDYMVDLEQKYFVLQDLIKEVRKYIKDEEKEGAKLVFRYEDGKYYEAGIEEILGSDKE